MDHRSLIEKLLYLDREFVTSLYEVLRGEAPATQITRSEAMNAGAKLPIFSAGLASTETKTFTVSTTAMLMSLFDELCHYPDASTPPLGDGDTSSICWFEGELSVAKIVLKGRERSKTPSPTSRPSANGEEVEKGAETIFELRSCSKTQLDLITSADYFTSGVAALVRINDVVIEQVSFPVKALVRVLPAKGSFGEWIAVPLVIIERRRDA